MKGESILALAVVVLLVGSSGSVCAGTYSGGTGEPNNPYRIATANDVNDIGNYPEDWSSHFIMVNDINLADYNGTQFNIIGTSGEPFAGVFDGNGHAISNFTYETNGNYVGLFGYVDGENAQIKNLGLIDPNVNAGTGDTVGPLIGRIQRGTVTNCYTKGGIVSGEDWVGGLAGANLSTISNCYAASNVLGGNGAIEVPGVGGLVGYNGTTGTMSNCYATGDVSSETATGGLVGSNYGTISNCYSIGGVSSSAAGGLVGHNYTTVTNSFWDTESSGQTWSSGGTGKTTVEMQTMSTFTDAGWDFVEVWNIGENQTYPFLRVYPAGDLNHDGVVNMRDFAIVASHWLEGTEP